MIKTTKQLAEEMGFCPSYIRILIRQGVIKAKKIGNFYVIDTKIKKIKRQRYPRKKPKEVKNGNKE